MQAPARPKIFHIVHIDRLSSIIADKGLLSDARVIELNRGGSIIGMNEIKERRLKELTLSCHQGLFVGQCVPFYFCPRSVMLYIIHCANHPGLAYRGGQEPIVHLEFDLHEVVNWAENNRRRWAFTLSNAGARYTDHYCDLKQLSELNWGAIASNNWSDPSFKEAKQSEFLIEESLPWALVRRIGSISPVVARRVANIIQNAEHHPKVEAKPTWYY